MGSAMPVRKLCLKGASPTTSPEKVILTPRRDADDNTRVSLQIANLRIELEKQKREQAEALLDEAEAKNVRLEQRIEGLSAVARALLLDKMDCNDVPRRIGSQAQTRSWIGCDAHDADIDALISGAANCAAAPCAAEKRTEHKAENIF